MPLKALSYNICILIIMMWMLRWIEDDVYEDAEADERMKRWWGSSGYYDEIDGDDDDVGEVDGEVIIFGNGEPMREASRWRRKPR